MDSNFFSHFSVNPAKFGVEEKRISKNNSVRVI